MKTAFLWLAIAGILSAQKLELKLDALAARAADTVDVQLDANMLQFAGRFLSGEGDQAKAKKMLSGLKGIYVRSFEFKNEKEYAVSDVEAIRAQLKAPAWTRIAGITSTKDGETTEIFMHKDGGLAIIAAEPKELTVVNIVGPIDLDALSDLGGHFGVPKLKKQ
jgi:hypothetical protein